MKKEIVVVSLPASAAKVAIIEDDLMIWSVDCWAEQIAEKVNQTKELYPDLKNTLTLISNPPIYAEKIRQSIEETTGFKVVQGVM